MQRKMRARDLGIKIGHLEVGKHNAITDVPHIRVGHVTVWHDQGGCARTGVTAIIPHQDNTFQEKPAAAVHVINGFGKAMGISQIEELGCIETPILLTNTLNIGTVADALIEHVLAENPQTRSINPVVLECNDGRLNEIEKRFVLRQHTLQALQEAKAGPVEEGAVGGGTGMIAFGYKAGIGTASRLVKVATTQYTVGLLVQANYGKRSHLIIDGVPIGRLLEETSENENGDGSIVMVLATDAPFDARQLRRLAKRVGMGLAKTGSIASHGSGDFVLAFSTTLRQHHGGESPLTSVIKLNDHGQVLSDFFQATIEATEEAILNALFASQSVTGRDDVTVEAIPLDKVKELISTYRYNNKV